jgi:hypothetical protein
VPKVIVGDEEEDDLKRDGELMLTPVVALLDCTVGVPKVIVEEEAGGDDVNVVDLPTLNPVVVVDEGVPKVIVGDEEENDVKLLTPVNSLLDCTVEVPKVIVEEEAGVADVKGVEPPTVNPVVVVDAVDSAEGVPKVIVEGVDEAEKGELPNVILVVVVDALDVKGGVPKEIDEEILEEEEDWKGVPKVPGVDEAEKDDVKVDELPTVKLVVLVAVLDCAGGVPKVIVGEVEEDGDVKLKLPK